jgi:hypothetical protein
VKQRKPLQRTGEIARTSPLRTKTPLERTSRLPSSGPIKAKRPRQSAEEKGAKRLVRTRSEGWCEIQLPCCVGRAFDFSHRIAKGRGGKWLASNGLDACRWCHTAITNTTGLRIVYERFGFIVQTGADTTSVPVWLPNRGLVLLADDGSTQDYQEARHG